MKKTIKIFTLVFLLLVICVGVDRYKNIRLEHNGNGTSSIFVNDGIWVNIPEEQWIEIDRNEFKPFQALLYVENYNLLLHKWDNTFQSLISYSYKNDGEGFSRTLHIYETVKQYEIADIRHVIYEDTIDNVQITYGSKTHSEYVLQFTKNDKTVNIEFYIEDLDRLKPLFESIWEDMKNNA